MATRAKIGITSADVRRIALELPEAVEQDHHGRPSFRVAGKIFATLPGPTHVNVMLAADAIEAVVQHESGACEELHWGKRLAGVSVALDRATAALARELLSEAWEAKAPRRLSATRRDRG